ncbi:transpeptidase family protein [bacterium]|nr:transpeptidase family protein [bacterium]
MERSFNNKIDKEEKKMQVKIFSIGLFLFVLLFVVLIRGIYLHSEGNEKVAALANRQYRSSDAVSLRRGKILDMKGRELAISVPVYSVFANPKVMEDKKNTATQLSKYLSISKTDIEAKLKQNKSFVWLERRIYEKTADRIKDLNLKGIDLLREGKRFYPNDDLASHVLGAVGYDSQALGGIEIVYDKYLRSQYTPETYEKDARGKKYYIPRDFEEQSDIGDVYLTIDKTIQFIAEKELKKTVERWNAKGGVVVVLDPYTGEILAMANYPTFNPNHYSNYDFKYWRNRVVTDVFEPGSTFKVVLAASALEAGVVRKNQKFYCEEGHLKVGRKVIHDTHPYADLTLSEIVKLSSNIGMYKISQLVERDLFYATIRSFGFGQKSGIDFPGEGAGLVSLPSEWSELQYSNISFGQGIAVTPLQLANAFAAIANGGRLMKPHLVKRIINHTGSVVYEAQHTVLSEPVSLGVSRELIKILEGVVEDGTGRLAESQKYHVAGKTGTAQKADQITGGYSEKYWASFVGFAPSENPRLVVLVAIDEPNGNNYGGVVSAPVFKNIMVESLQYLSVPHSGGSNEKEYYVGKDAEDPFAGLRKNKQVPRFGEAGEDKFIVPNLKGLTMREVLQAIGKTDVGIRFHGSGIAFKQSVSPGEVIKKGQKLVINFES